MMHAHHCASADRDTSHRLAGTRCWHCRREVTYGSANGDYRRRPPTEDEVVVCLRCVALLLCTASCQIHGDLNRGCASGEHAGHEHRIAQHAHRIATEGPLHSVGEESA